MSSLDDTSNLEVLNYRVESDLNEVLVTDSDPIVNQSNPVIFQPSGSVEDGPKVGESTKAVGSPRRRICIICWNIRGIYFDT
jgi:hypothetical protein